MKLYSWGGNSYGQLGQGRASNQCIIPYEVNTSDCNFKLEDVVSIVGGGGHTFLLTNNGHLYGCGWNNAGQLGGKIVEHHKLTPFTAAEDIQVAQLSSKWDTCFALTKSNQCVGWGSNAFGQLGRPMFRLTKTEVPIELVPINCKQVEAGLRHCAVVADTGYVMTAGDARKGQLGRPISQMAHSFRPVPGLKRVRSVACGQHHTLAITEDNKLYGWGCNKYGQLGVDPTLHQIVLYPLEIPLPQDSIDESTRIYSGWTHSALLTGDGTVINWGRNKYGQLGTLSFDRHVEWKPERMKDMKKVKQLYLGSEHNLAILDDGVLMSWGWNEHGSCGVGHCMDVMKPTCVELNSKVVLAGVGTGHSFAIASVDQ